jgi:hypothetical protein
MKEKEASPGDKLCALMIATSLRISFKRALEEYVEDPVAESWEVLAEVLRRGTIEALESIGHGPSTKGIGKPDLGREDV